MGRQSTLFVLIGHPVPWDPIHKPPQQPAWYRYNVETLEDGRSIYLTCPARLKKGFDFRISVENIVFLTGRDYPRHENVVRDVRAKKRAHPRKAKRLLSAIERVYGCDDPEEVLASMKPFDFDRGYSVERL